MANPTPPPSNPSRPTTTNPHDVTRPLAPGSRPSTAPARQISAAPLGSDNPARMRSGSAADMTTQEQNRNSPTSVKGRHDASERRIRDQGQESERATQLRNERATNVVDPATSAFVQRVPGAIQASVSRLNGIHGRMGELVGAQPSTSVRAGENPDTKAKAEYERLRGLAKLELDYLSSIGKSPDDPIPEPPAEPKLRL